MSTVVLIACRTGGFGCLQISVLALNLLLPSLFERYHNELQTTEKEVKSKETDRTDWTWRNEPQPLQDSKEYEPVLAVEESYGTQIDETCGCGVVPPLSVLWGYSSDTTGPALGESHTLTDAVKRAEFWALFSTLCVVYGAGLTLPNNLSSIVRALDADYDAAPFTTFSSIFQSLGRLSGGVVSEYNLQVHGTSRATSFGIWVAMFSLSSIVFAFTDSIGMLYVTVPMSTFTFGGVITIFAPLCSELFGLLNMGMIYTVLRASVFVGSLVFGRDGRSPFAGPGKPESKVVVLGSRQI
ncbi:hypothetical protein CYMTET_17955 [Cymbomonas tetramitiformis]|uniref:NFD4 C-terminal domain-containing protein n=1 Tax=Cymbomonas tetramitiformis TaxID=36881 RepID=A0AAE0G904_9CHLO|nr:hypothetical protein CYMTET_17955 [Cymbomonas tetramitiformis]